MALPNGLAQSSDLGALLSTLGNDVLSVPKIAVPFTTITNRAQIYDLSKDLGVRMGVNRIHFNQLIQLQDEFGPNGEPVWSVANDTYGQIRLVGSTWTKQNDVNGQRVQATAVGDYLEVTYYGTGLNLLMFPSDNTKDVRASIDGGAEGANIYGGTTDSAVTISRNFSPNIIKNVANGQTLGTHTAKIRHVLNNIQVMGIEVLNESTNMKVNVGSIWKGGQRRYNPTQQSFAYNTNFESGILGSRGGRVVVYQKPDMSIAKSVTPTNSSQQNLAAADHSNEEVARTYFLREAGTGRADDFSADLFSGSNTVAGTLECNTTSIIGNAIQVHSSGQGLGYESALYQAGGSFVTIIFVGTGLDVFLTTNNGTIPVTLNGSSIGSITPQVDRVMKVASGLPYGVHTAQFNNSSASGGIAKFIVYQPKKPTLPTDAVELATYNIMADYSRDNTSGNITSNPTGALFKGPMREATYVGAGWTANLASTNVKAAQYTTTATGGNYVEWSFLGTNVEIEGTGSGASSTVQLDGVAYTGAATAVGTGSSWTPGTSTWAMASVNGARLAIGGLSYGWHKVRVTLSSGTMFMHGMQYSSLIHSYKENGPFIMGNTLSCGSQGVGDSRKLVESYLKTKVAHTFGVNGGITTSTTSSVPVPDMSVTLKTDGGDLEISYSMYQRNTTSAFNLSTIYVDGLPLPVSMILLPSIGSSSQRLPYQGQMAVPAAPGYHKIDIYWNVNGGTATSDDSGRYLKVREVKDKL